MKSMQRPVWKEAPFIRLVIPLMSGIILEYFSRTGEFIYLAALASCLAGVWTFSRFPLAVRFRHAGIQGLLISGALLALGGLLICGSDPSSRVQLVERLCRDSAVIVVTLKEPAALRPKSFKALAAISSIQHGNTIADLRTDILVYIKRDSTASPPVYGDRIAFTKSPARIKNFTGAGGFDYEKYCARRNLYFQVFLGGGQYAVLEKKSAAWLPGVLFGVQKWVIRVLQRNIHRPKECGLAEALLIGYKDDLDRQLIQSYANTGVVHVVAISGLHLGLIYALLKRLCMPLGKKKTGKWISAVLIIAGLWLFSLLAGGAPSVLRSAVMFSFIVAGEAVNRKASLFNNLAASAFFLLCVNPYWLWDIGFQLSYAALVSIVIFMKPVYHLFIFKNRIADAVWKLNAVTIAAQILTAPVCIYYFHQFPTLFIVTNFIAVPLSGVILTGEIALCGLTFIPAVARPAGWVLEWLLKIMNAVVEAVNDCGFSAVTGLNISFLQVILLYLLIAAASAWLIFQRRQGLVLALVAGILFMAVRLI